MALEVSIHARVERATDGNNYNFQYCVVSIHARVERATWLGAMNRLQP